MPMFTDADLRRMLKSVSNDPSIKKLRERLKNMSNQEVADRLKPVAKHNKYAKDLLKSARKKGLAK